MLALLFYSPFFNIPIYFCYLFGVLTVFFWKMCLSKRLSLCLRVYHSTNSPVVVVKWKYLRLQLFTLAYVEISHSLTTTYYQMLYSRPTKSVIFMTSDKIENIFHFGLVELNLKCRAWGALDPVHDFYVPQIMLTKAVYV